MSDSDLKVFLSYANVDDDPPPDLPGVDGFVTFLREQLAYQFSQMGTPRPKIWHDQIRISNGDQFGEKIRRGLEEAALLVVVLSSNWMEREWCRKELNDFVARWKSEDRESLLTRIVVVGKRHVEPHARPELLQGQVGFRFYTRDEDDHVASEREFFSRGRPRDDRYHETVAALAEHIWKCAAELRRRQGAPAAPPVPPAPAQVRPYSPNGRTLFVAKPAADMSEPYHRIVRELEGAGYAVVPDPRSEMPRGSDALSYVDEALAKAEASIHLLGDKPGFAPDDASLDRIVKLQLVRAAARTEAPAPTASRAFRRIVWAPKILDDGGGGASARERDPILVLEGFDRQLPTDKIDGGVSSRFAGFLIQHLAVSRTNERASLPMSAGATMRLYLCHNEADENYAFDLAEALGGWPVETLMPAFDGPEPDLRRIHQRNLEDCDAVAVCWANATEAWARSAAIELRDWQSLGRQRQFAYRTIVAGPPPMNRKSAKALAHIFPRAQIDRIIDLVDKGPLAPEQLRDLAPQIAVEPS